MRQALASRTLVRGEGESTAAPPPSPEEIADKFPQFEILECLGRGGMGVVYKARQKSLNRLVAIKILAPERESELRFAERFAREAELLAKLNHPHIVTIHDFGEIGGLFYLVMEFVDGVNLRDLLRDGKLEPKQALAIVPPICEALQYAHAKGIVHRDIKPENLLLDREGRIKIADFGIAGLVGAGGENIGTPPYMAPEQRGNSTEVDSRADIYALGVVLYEMLTGERPGKDIIAPSRKFSIDVRLDELVLRALEKEPEKRYQTAGEFMTVVNAVTAACQQEPESPRRKKRRKKVIFRFPDPMPDRNVLLGIALALLMAGVAIMVLMEGFGVRARDFIDRTLDPETSAEGHYIRSILWLLCLVPIVALIGRLIKWLRRTGPGTRAGTEKPALDYGWRFLGLAALVLVFSNPWGAVGWQWLIAATALLLILELPGALKSKAEPPGTPDPQGMMRGDFHRIIKWVVLGAMLGLIGLVWFMTRSGDSDPASSHGAADKTSVMGRASAAAAETHAVAFGPMIEKTVNEMESGLGAEGLRFTSGELVSMPKENADNWLADTAVDLLIGVADKHFQLILHKGILWDMENADWENATPEILGKALEKGPGMMKPGKSENRWMAYEWTGGELPVSLAFGLASGVQGMLQVMGVSPGGTGLRIRYKLLPGATVETIRRSDFERARAHATEMAQRHFKDLEMTMDGDRFVMQRAMREYEVHNSSKTGEVSPETHKVKGPSADGFILVLEPIVEAPVSQALHVISQADSPQILDRPYWKGFIDFRIDPENHSGVALFFDFGAALPNAFKEEILRLLHPASPTEKANDAGSAEALARRMLEAEQLVKAANEYVDLVLAVAEARCSGLGEKHPSVLLTQKAMARFKANHPDLSKAVLEKAAAERLARFKEELARLQDNGMGPAHPTILEVKARIEALAAISQP